MKRACYFGIYDLLHSRTRIIKKGLASAGYEVIECQVDPRKISGIKKYTELIHKYRSLQKDKPFDLIVVGFPGYFTVLVVFAISSYPLIFDAYISYFDGVRDRKNYSLFHPRLWYAWSVDFLNGLVSDVVLTINFAYRDFFVSKLKVASRKMEVLHKGADETVFFPRQALENKSNTHVIGWWGSFIPLHGLPVIVEAAKHLEDSSNMEFHIYGGGQLRVDIGKQIKVNDVKNVKLLPFIPRPELVNKIKDFDLVLGIFNSSPKSQRCVTNKVYEAMAMGKAIITQNSEANREIFTHKVNAYLVEPGNARALADAIIALVNDKSLRDKIAKGAETIFKEKFATKHIENEFVDILRRHGL
ncbi:MAG: hypothetical protein A2741_00415 [Candidatus Zambryskibacteria bacterium RIFCSPHIGHO2_01_FULL_43_27]|uniref:Glycosyl transferase family 1 domain-containing protein n=1 Tax=Candidatus Zambryskibacteria bacterium RIFCSPLOWO2_01_FULL_43_17 TaxID=1802760 RepID=A0A1G2U209_9BACT|nr:MAG: hypothetical protein A2741_00415 [Candidatus Zambryskibacteria bacterium RIFCSPHIGHO2_01_FULL_43_27]OHB03557.1 MAG: hypothetical protein A2920_02750 [Candidatus Zambryskibacteria bacterium RIFCSPLOWO2_01_FULL_43_17]